ncbi:hypothetical protein C8F01DRAFT_217901 [Mycena amicta]|nr:hypothetical protein C8F01DRAFT_217901 [Mycena amicta]
MTSDNQWLCIQPLAFPTMDDPRLPPELEREIFELAAENHPEMVVHLINVAHRVLEWTEPFLYRTVRVRNSPAFEAFQRVLLTRPRTILAAGVRHVHFEAREECTYEICFEIISKCPGIRRIGTTNRFTGPQALEALGTLTNVNHLAVNLCGLFTTEWYPTPDQMDSTHPAFARVTHLSLHDNMQRDVIRKRNCAILPGLPRLTHLRLKLSGLPPADIQHLLTSCALLEIFILTTASRSSVTEKPGYALVSADPRLVWGQVADHYDLFWDDWRRGADGLVDMWALAEEAVRKRKQNPSNDIEWVGGTTSVPVEQLDEDVSGSLSFDDD